MSSILACKNQLVTRFAADPAIGGAGAVVTFGLPSAPTRQPPPLWVFLGNTRPEDGTGSSEFRGGQTTAAIGRPSKREERYIQECVVSYLGDPLAQQLSVSTTALTIADAVEQNVVNWFSTTPSSYDGIVRWALVTSMYHREGASDGTGARFCDVYLDISISNRLSL